MQEISALLLSNMEASKKAFKLLQLKLQEIGFCVHSFLGAGDIEKQISRPENLADYFGYDGIHPSRGRRIIVDVLIVGITTTERFTGLHIWPSAHETTAIEFALSRGISVFCYADACDSLNCERYREFMEKMDGIFVINEQEVSKGKKVFPKANFIITGNLTSEKEDVVIQKMMQAILKLVETRK